jgi:hypothetical protein
LREGKETALPVVEAFIRYETEEFDGTLVVKSSDSRVEADSKTKRDSHRDGLLNFKIVGCRKKAGQL